MALTPSTSLAGVVGINEGFSQSNSKFLSRSCSRDARHE